MTLDFPLHDPSSRDELRPVEKAFGFVPNLAAILAEAPAALKGYLALSQAFESSSLDATQQQVVLLTASRANGCDYCMAAHSAIAGMKDVPAGVVQALRGDDPIDDAKLEALRGFTRAVVDSRGNPPEDDVRSFLEAGHTKANVLEVLTGVAQKTLSNYVNHLAGTPLDDAFADHAWAPPGR